MNKYVNRIKEELENINTCPFNSDIICRKAGIIRRLALPNKSKADMEKVIKDNPVLTYCKGCVWYRRYKEKHG
jgi:hypothetical protein